MKTTHERVCDVMRERNLPIPASTTETYTEPMAWPYKPRALHRRYAKLNGYFWLPCPLCGLEFGGHERVLYTQIGSDQFWERTGICPKCTVRRTGGVLS